MTVDELFEYLKELRRGGYGDFKIIAEIRDRNCLNVYSFTEHDLIGKVINVEDREVILCEGFGG